MVFHVISIFPEFVSSLGSAGILERAIQNRAIEIKTYNPRDHVEGVRRQVDDRPFGGGDGMLMMAEPLASVMKAMSPFLSSSSKKYYLSPRGKLFSDSMAREMSLLPEVVLLCGRYGGVDQRFLDSHGFEELSIGDYVLSGGELAAMVTIDSVSRFIPSVLGNADSSQNESFSDGLLEASQFTRPAVWSGIAVPEVLLGGNHRSIQNWRESLGVLITAQNRPDLLLSLLHKDQARGRGLIRAALKTLHSLSEQELRVSGIRSQGELRLFLEGFL